MKRRIVIVVALAALIAAVFIVEAGQRAAPAAGSPARGAAAEGAAVTPPPPAATATEVTPASQPAALPRLVDLGSTRCIPCKMMAPILEALRRDFAGELVVEVIDVREDREAADAYGVRVIPTQVFLDAGDRERFRHEGYMPREAIVARWRELGVELGGGGGGAGAASPPAAGRW